MLSHWYSRNLGLWSKTNLPSITWNSIRAFRLTRIVNRWSNFMDLMLSLQPQVKLWSRSLSRVSVRSRPLGSPVKRPPGWDPKRALCASTGRRWRPKWRPTRWKRWNLHGLNRWGLRKHHMLQLCLNLASRMCHNHKYRLNFHISCYIFLHVWHRWCFLISVNKKRQHITDTACGTESQQQLQCPYC